MLRYLLEHPLTRGLNIDDGNTIMLRRQIIKEKKFLRKIYNEWYEAIVDDLPPLSGPILEVGSGAGFFSDYIPDLITSEVYYLPGISVSLDCRKLPFADNSLRAIVMVDVLHHIPGVKDFFREAARCVRPGGAVIMYEPWVSDWSRFVYTRLHHESFEPGSADWSFPEEGPLSGANSALPWIIFQRDLSCFTREFSSWNIESIEPGMPLRYLLSGGVSMRSLMPVWSFGFWRWIEEHLLANMQKWAMFAKIVIKQNG